MHRSAILALSFGFTFFSLSVPPGSGGELGAAWSAWLGEYSVVDDDWIYHVEHGWLHVVGDGADHLYYYDPGIDVWGWTGAGAYPWYFWYAPVNSWGFYSLSGAPGNRWFFVYAWDQWVSDSNFALPLEAMVYGFADPDSDVVAVIPGSAGTPDIVIFQDVETGEVNRIQYVYEDGADSEIMIGSDGHVSEYRIGDDRWEFHDRSAFGLHIIWYPADGSEPVLYIIGPDDVESQTAEGAVPAAITWEQHMDRLDRQIDETVGVLTDPFEIYGPLWVYKQAGEYVAGKVGGAIESVDRFVNEARDNVNRFRNGIRCFIGVGSCGETVAREVGSAAEQLERMDPGRTTTAGFEVRETGLEPVRDDWHREREINTEFRIIEVPCEESIFADLNPECPQYVPPHDDPGGDDPGGGGDPGSDDDPGGDPGGEGGPSWDDVLPFLSADSFLNIGDTWNVGNSPRGSQWRTVSVTERDPATGLNRRKSVGEVRWDEDQGEWFLRWFRIYEVNTRACDNSNERCYELYREWHSPTNGSGLSEASFGYQGPGFFGVRFIGWHYNNRGLRSITLKQYNDEGVAHGTYYYCNHSAGFLAIGKYENGTVVDSDDSEWIPIERDVSECDDVVEKMEDYFRHFTEPPEIPAGLLPLSPEG